MAGWFPRSKVCVGLSYLFHLAAYIWLLLFVLQVFYADLPLLERLFEPPLVHHVHGSTCIWKWHSGPPTVMLYLFAVFLFGVTVAYVFYFLGFIFFQFNIYTFQKIISIIYAFGWFFLLSWYGLIALIVSLAQEPELPSQWPWTLECHMKCQSHGSTELKSGCESSYVMPSFVVVGVESALIIIGGVFYRIS